MEKKTKICLIVAFVIGVVLLILGCVLGFVVFPNEVEKQIKENVILNTGTEQWDRFVKLPIPLSFKVYLFEVTNRDDVLTGKTPIVKEKGPYVYQQAREKNTVEYRNGKDHVSYKEIQKFEFDTKASGKLKDTDTLYALHVPYLATLQISESIGVALPFDFEKDVLDHMFPKRNIFIKTTVKDLLFDGINFCLPDEATLGSKIYCMVVTILKLKNIKSNQDGSKTFSFLDFKNNKDGGLWEVDTGIADYKNLGEIYKWENSEYTKFWKGDKSTCNKVEGRDSTIYPPLIEKDQIFTIFSNDICRKVRMSFTGESTFKDIDAFRFESDEDMLNEDKPASSCYCLQKTKNEEGAESCFLDGVLDLYSCYGAPILASYPHFLFADAKYKNMVEGLNPKKNSHTSYCDIEPNTGTPLKGVKRIQFNMVVRKYLSPQRNEAGHDKYVDQSKDLKGGLIPALWVEEGVELTDEYIEKLNDMYFNIVKILEGVKWGLIAVSIVVIVVSLGFTCYKCKRS